MYEKHYSVYGLCRREIKKCVSSVKCPNYASVSNNHCSMRISLTLKVLKFLKIHLEMEQVELLTVTIAENPCGWVWGK